MTTFPVHSLDTAPDASKPILTAVQKSFGFVPNLYRVMAEAPAAAEAYASLMDIFGRSSLFFRNSSPNDSPPSASTLDSGIIGRIYGIDDVGVPEKYPLPGYEFVVIPKNYYHSWGRCCSSGCSVACPR